MVKFTVRRILQSIPTIIGITIIAFAIMVLAPGNPATQLTANDPTMTPQQRQAIAEAMGLNAPVHEQYARWLIGDAPIKFGPIGFNMTTVEQCKEAARDLNIELPICDNVLYSGETLLQEDDLLAVRGRAYIVEGDEILRSDRVLENTEELSGTEILNLIVDDEIIEVDNRGIVVINNGAVTIKDREVVGVQEPFTTASGSALTAEGDQLLLNGEPVTSVPRLITISGESGLPMLRGRDPLTDADTLLVSGDLIFDVNKEVIEYNADSVVVATGSIRSLPVTPAVAEFTLVDATVEGSILSYNGAPIVVDSSIARVENGELLLRNTPVGPETLLTVVGDRLLSVNSEIIGDNNQIVVSEGNVYLRDYEAITGTVLWAGQATIWEGRRLPVFDRAGNRLEGEYTVGYSGGVLRGDLGQSLISQQPVSQLFGERLPATMELGALALLVGLLVGIPVGVLAAVYQGSIFDQITRVGAVIVSAVPIFWLGLMLLLIFGAWLNWLPMGNRFPTNVVGDYTLWDRISHLLLPVLTLSTGTIATYSRFMRASLLDVLNQDYIRTARAKGLANRRVWFLHGMRNALIPIATLLGPSLTFIISGAVLTETIYSWPGMGRLLVASVQQQDYPVIMGMTLLFSLAAIIGFLLSDIFYALLDPRIRLS